MRLHALRLLTFASLPPVEKPVMLDMPALPVLTPAIQEGQRRHNAIEALVNGDEIRWGPDAEPSPRWHNAKLPSHRRDKTPTTPEDHARLEAAEAKRQRRKEKRR